MKKFLFLITMVVALGMSAQTTNTALNAQIDAQIINATGTGSITKTIMGNNLKDIVAYIVQVITTVETTVNTKAPLASPILTGDPKAPTPATSDNDSSVATTAFVNAAIATSGGGGGAPVDSPVFTGDPQAPTPTFFDNDESVATTSFVMQHAGVSPGEEFENSGNSYSNPLQTIYHKVFFSFYQSSTVNPQVNVFYPCRGMPAGITRTFTRTGVGTFQITISGDENLAGMVGGNAINNIVIRFSGSCNFRRTAAVTTITGGIKTHTFTFVSYDLTGTPVDGVFDSYQEILFYNFD